MNPVLLIAIAVPAVTLIVDAIWALEQADFRKAVEKTARACDGRVRSPSGFFTRPCPKRAIVFTNDRHRCLDTKCEQSKTHAA